MDKTIAEEIEDDLNTELSDMDNELTEDVTNVGSDMGEGFKELGLMILVALKPYMDKFVNFIKIIYSKLHCKIFKNKQTK